MRLIFTLFLLVFPLFLAGQNNQRIDIDFEGVVNPLTGGFEAPQFQAINLNDDGKMDLLVFDRKGSSLRTFLYDESLECRYSYAPEYEHLFPKIPCWVIVRDFNSDGVDDLFTCGVTDPVTGIEVWQGKRENEILSFEAFKHPNGPYNIIYYESNNLSYKQLYVGNNGIPGIEDVDGDGDLDILAFQPSGGYLYYFKNMSQERGYGSDSLVFERADDCWGNFYEGGLIPDIILSNDNESCAIPKGVIASSDRHEGITLSIFDKDGNGVKDLLIGEVSSPNLIYVENGGSKEDAFATFKEVNFPSDDVPADIQIFLGSFILDVDHDGKEDLLVAPNSQFGTNTNQVSYYRNVDNSYQLIQDDWLVGHTLDFGTDSHPAFVDVNQDGLIDLVIGSYGLVGLDGGAQTRLYLYENQGSLSQPQFILKDDNYLDFLAYSEFDKSYVPSFGDIDGDKDLDLMLGTLSGDFVYLENIAGEGNPLQFSNPIFDFQGLNSENNTTRIAITDLDNDGLGDLVVGGRNSYSLPETIGSLKFFKNIGSPGNPEFSNTNVVRGIGGVNMKDPGTSRVSASPKFYINGSENLLFVGNETGRIALYRLNAVGEDYELLDEDLLGIYFGRRVALDVYDIDNDGYLEIVAGNERGGLNFFNTVVQVSGEISSVEEEYRVDFKVYPNPVVEVLYFDKVLSNVMIYNNLGELVLRSTRPIDRIFVTELPSGVYYLRSGQNLAKFTKL